jgi:hypothetical protein
MDTHRIPLCNVNKYLRTFFPPRPKSDKAYYASKGKLRVFLHLSQLHNRDLLPLIKHVHRFPRRAVETVHFNGQISEQAQGLGQLLEHRNPTWIRWISGNVISQVRLDQSDVQHNSIILVVKEKHATAWMKSMASPSPSGIHANDYLVFLASVGLNTIVGWEFHFRVDYR